MTAKQLELRYNLIFTTTAIRNGNSEIRTVEFTNQTADTIIRPDRQRTASLIFLIDRLGAERDAYPAGFTPIPVNRLIKKNLLFSTCRHGYWNLYADSDCTFPVKYKF